MELWIDYSVEVDVPGPFFYSQLPRERLKDFNIKKTSFIKIKESLTFLKQSQKPRKERTKMKKGFYMFS